MVETLFTDLTFGDHGGGPMGGRVAPAALVYTMTEGLLVQSTMQTTGLALLEVEKKVLPRVCRRHHLRGGRSHGGPGHEQG